MPATVHLSSTHPYTALTPELILDAVETYGVRCTGGLLALNSYENRVYRVETEEGGVLVAKLYRPRRWSDAAILEEHAFVRLLAEHDIPAIPPLAANGATLNHHRGFGFAVFPWQPGRASELNHPDERVMLGRYLGRLHRLGAAAPFRDRPMLTIQNHGHEPVAYLLENGFIPDYLHAPFKTLAETLLRATEQIFAGVDHRTLRLHGDCHLGNILWRRSASISSISMIAAWDPRSRTSGCCSPAHTKKARCNLPTFSRAIPNLPILIRPSCN